MESGNKAHVPQLGKLTETDAPKPALQRRHNRGHSGIEGFPGNLEGEHQVVS